MNRQLVERVFVLGEITGQVLKPCGAAQKPHCRQLRAGLLTGPRHGAGDIGFRQRGLCDLAACDCAVQRAVGLPAAPLAGQITLNDAIRQSRPRQLIEDRGILARQRLRASALQGQHQTHQVHLALDTCFALGVLQVGTNRFNRTIACFGNAGQFVASR